MTAQSNKPTQKRLHNCVLSQPKWAQNPQNAPTKRPRTPKGSYFKANTIARVENAPENAQARCNTKLLGKYPIKYLVYENITKENRELGSRLIKLDPQPH